MQTLSHAETRKVETSKAEFVILIEDDGTMVFLDKPELAGLDAQGETVKRRASHVEPCGTLRRQAFHLLRRAFGENGRVADWTRSWKCHWRINLAPLGGGILGRFACRECAIKVEVDWLNMFYLGDVTPEERELAMAL